VARELGAVQGEFRAAERALLPALAIGLGVLAVLVAVAAVVTPPRGLEWLVPIVFFALFGGLAAAFGWGAVAGRDDRVILHEHGLRIVALGVERAIRWSSVDAVTLAGSATPRFAIVTLWLDDGDKVRVLGTPVERNEEFVTAIEDAIIRERAPIVVDQLANDHPVSFGPVVLRGSGIRHGERVLPWEDLRGVDERDGKLVIRDAEGEWAALDGDHVSNVALLAAILRARCDEPS